MPDTKTQISETEKISVAIAEHDMAYFRKLASVINKQKDMKIVASLVVAGFPGNEQKALDFGDELARLQPNVILLDAELIRQAAALDLDLLRRERKRLPASKLVVMEDRYVEEAILAMVMEGIRGFFLRTIDERFIAKCVRVVERGEIWLDSHMVVRIVEGLVAYFERRYPTLQTPSPEAAERIKLLSPREMEILQNLSMSHTNDEIAHKLFISEKTVKTHVRNIFEKTGVKNRVEATLLYVRSEIGIEGVRH